MKTICCLLTTLSFRLMEAEHNRCTCSQQPSLMGDGSQDAPFELEYEDSEYVTPPITSAASSPPSENTAPIPVMVLRYGPSLQWFN